MGRKVVVEPHNPQWKVLFEIEAQALRGVFGEQVVAIYHFGSTAIPGILAKPIIDILMTVQEIESVKKRQPRLERMGYHAQGEYGIPGRRFFYKGTFDDRSYHLHIYQFDNPNILRHIAFRDYLCENPVPARQYAALKERLAHEFPEDMDSYIAGKNDFVKEHEVRALEWWHKHHDA